MINIQEETRHRIEAKVSSLTSKLSDSINYMLEKKRVDAAEAKKNNILLLCVLSKDMTCIIDNENI